MLYDSQRNRDVCKTGGSAVSTVHWSGTAGRIHDGDFAKIAVRGAHVGTLSIQPSTNIRGNASKSRRIGVGTGRHTFSLRKRRLTQMIVTLVGYRGSGKSSVGPLLADLLGCKCVDSDDQIEFKAGKPITEIFSQNGEPAFRQL